MHLFVRMWFVFAQSRTERQACMKWPDFRGDTTNHRWLQKMCRLPSEGLFDKPHIACLTCKEGIALLASCNQQAPAILPAWLWLSPWQARLSSAPDASTAMLSVVRFTLFLLRRWISCNAAYHDKLRCKALQSLQIECIDVSRVETGNSNTSTRKQMTWNMSAWL